MRTLLYLHDLVFRIGRETRGAIASEYAFLIVFIAIIAAFGMVLLGTELSEYFSTLGTAIGTSAQQS
jgi:Flp pilus assembly pilin Flp